MFIIYTNGLQKILNYSKLFAFADDLAIITVHRNVQLVEKYMGNDLIAVSKWAHDHNLTISTSKT